jgi:hypothetical protein
MDNRAFQTLTDYLSKVPGVEIINTGTYENGLWWLKLKIDIENKLAWQVVQEFGCVLNYLSINERLPTVFYPVSPAPYLNGGPDEFLSWIIESRDADFRPGTLMKWLEGRLPQPVDDISQWSADEGD